MKTLKLLIVCLLLTAGHILANAQVDPDSTATGTSYLREGNDDFNLIESVVNNDKEITEQLLRRGANPNATSTTGNTALMYATESGNIEIMALLIEYGAKVNSPGYKLDTPLLIAVFNNDFNTAKFLLKNGADPNVKDSYGVTPLLYAAAANQYQSADLLLFFGADEQITDRKGNDPLITAVTFENIEVTDVLLQNGLNPNVRDDKGDTPVIIATQHSRHDILDLLLDYNANVNISNYKGYTPLAYAIAYNDVKAARMLIRNGADVYHQIDRSMNLADLAKVTRNDSLSALLEENGAQMTSSLDFSEFRLTHGNSFNSTDYFLQFRGGYIDSKYGYYFQTGIDYRPFLLKIQKPINDTIYQFRERRIGWSHSIGRYFNLYRSESGKNISFYGSLSGYLSFLKYTGSSLAPFAQYHLIPSAGFSYCGNAAGIKIGVDWYQFDTSFDKSLKFNLSVFYRISYPKIQFDRKEIYWE
ncbi:MAG: ankyrin repeat domain-containing protein [Bacteroidales bacterium]|nr:ankyrin repeat domain-containing protein [Bacteroidales bacterium]